MQPAIGIQLNRAQSSRDTVSLIYSTRVSAHPDRTTEPATSTTVSHPWVLILTNHTTTTITAAAEVTIHQGGEVHLECQASGVPTPLLSWVLPDRSVLTPMANSGNRISMYPNGTLHISSTLPSDRGAYRCVASNSAGAASASVRLHMSSLPPVIQQPREENLLLAPGGPLYAHCTARGAPPPTLRWRTPDGALVRPSQFLHGNLFVLPNGTLHIRKIGPKDAGSYECTSFNAVGTDKRTVRVEMKEEAQQAEVIRDAKNIGRTIIGMNKSFSLLFLMCLQEIDHNKKGYLPMGKKKKKHDRIFRKADVRQ
uniref:Ig-like domain-containing protein n=1 Tax=Hippocampus comes TaxID=109280 RepID=A0A3Q2Z189_HIPCM